MSLLKTLQKKLSPNENTTNNFTQGSSLPIISDNANNAWGDNDWGTTTNKEENLNKLTTEELNEVKAEMDVDFRKNQIQPGQPGYQYDVRKQFDGDKADNSWDEGVVSQDDDDYFEDDFV